MKILLKRPFSASIPAWLAVGNMAMAPKHVYDTKGDLRNDAMGTGPFKLKSYSAGIGMEVVKNPNYFVPGRPYLDGITAYIIKDRGTLLAAFRTGRIKMPVPYVYVTPSEAKMIQTNVPQAVVQPFKSLRFGQFSIKMIDKPWSDIRLRRAVFLAADRQAALKAVGEGEGTLGVTNIAGAWAIPQDELLKMPGFRQPKDADIAEAKKLLAEAGFATSLETKILARPGYGADVKLAEFMSDQLSKIGIRAAVDVQESATWLDRQDRGAYETIVSNDGIDITDPDAAASLSVKGNRYFVTDEKLFELFDKQGRTTDLVERKKLVLELQYRVAELAPYVISVWFSHYITFWPEIRNYKAGTGQHNNSKYQDVWLAK